MRSSASACARGRASRSSRGPVRTTRSAPSSSSRAPNGALGGPGTGRGPVDVEASLDEFNLDVRLSWQGDELKLPDKRPSEEEIRETEEGLLLLAGYLIQATADGVRGS